MTTLSKEKVQAISSLYNVSEAFRKTVDSAILTEANLASNMAKVLSAAVGPAVVDPAPVKSPGKKRGPKPGSKRKASKKTVKKSDAPVNSTEVTTTARVTHKDAILRVLAAAGGTGMTKKDIETRLADINGYTVPASATLLTTLHGMKTAGAIVSSGERPNLHYNLSK